MLKLYNKSDLLVDVDGKAYRQSDLLQGRKIPIKTKGSLFPSSGIVIDETGTKHNLINLLYRAGSGGGSSSDGTNGVDGREIELQKQNDAIYWRYVGEPSWVKLLDLSEITGKDGIDGIDGKDGKDGREIEISIEQDNIVWNFVGETQKNILINKQDLKGQDGQDANIDTSSFATVDSIEEINSTINTLTQEMNTLKKDMSKKGRKLLWSGNVTEDDVTITLNDKYTNYDVLEFVINHNGFESRLADFKTSKSHVIRIYNIADSLTSYTYTLSETRLFATTENIITIQGSKVMEFKSTNGDSFTSVNKNPSGIEIRAIFGYKF